MVWKEGEKRLQTKRNGIKDERYNLHTHTHTKDNDNNNNTRKIQLACILVVYPDKSALTHSTIKLSVKTPQLCREYLVLQDSQKWTSS